MVQQLSTIDRRGGVAMVNQRGWLILAAAPAPRCLESLLLTGADSKDCVREGWSAMRWAVLLDLKTFVVWFRWARAGRRALYQVSLSPLPCLFPLGEISDWRLYLPAPEPGRDGTDERMVSHAYWWMFTVPPPLSLSLSLFLCLSLSLSLSFSHSISRSHFVSLSEVCQLEMCLIGCLSTLLIHGLNQVDPRIFAVPLPPPDNTHQTRKKAGQGEALTAQVWRHTQNKKIMM